MSEKLIKLYLYLEEATKLTTGFCLCQKVWILSLKWYRLNWKALGYTHIKQIWSPMTIISKAFSEQKNNFKGNQQVPIASSCEEKTECCQAICTELVVYVCLRGGERQRTHWSVQFAFQGT